ncbi:ABC transporter permease [Agromyces sp. H3Y2-19a]|jgi:ABC-2 type transport system permease protein|uniref:ABC transporter permease n=1 Tax=Agromyces TaxID=33877 RepID=UPI001E2E9564|nr:MULTISPECIES: ABC transporter permease [Agromyces]MCD5346955.1 ABC transporter permease [Agromyces sp. S2-1-8]MDF0515145.1 ABC transporter permease [Agromyces chromiiresistens]
MTTITPTATHPAQGARSTRLTFGGVLSSEWIKLRSLRSTVWSYLIVIAISLGMALLMSLSMVNGMGGGMDIDGAPVEQQHELVMQASTFGVYFGQLVVGVLGVLVISGEYTTGMIRSTLTAVPQRLPALAAKGVVLFVATFVIGMLANLGAYLTATIVFGTDLELLDADTLLTLAGGALYLALVAVFALGVGTIIRSSAGGIAAVLGLLLLLPTVLQLIPADWAHDAIPYLLSSSGMTMFMAIGAEDSAIVGPNAWQSLLVVLAWVGVSIAGASVLLKRRDA